VRLLALPDDRQEFGAKDVAMAAPEFDRPVRVKAEHREPREHLL
jgi:hypothetical protein